jgi:Domain of unknown function (DUF4389)
VNEQEENDGPALVPTPPPQPLQVLPPSPPISAPPPVLPPPSAGGIPPGASWPIATEPAGYPDLSPPELPLPLLAIMPERAKQRRWTVLLRAFLALPLSVVVIAVYVVAVICVILGWFAALVMGRVPAFVRTIVTVFLHMLLRLEAYVFLLTDRFPPFSTQDMPEYGASLAVPPATRLNRAAVLFRFILVIPAAIAARITWLGLQIVMFFMWFVVLVTGWLPKPVHEVARVFIRYELRFFGYYFLLVPTYPGELFGDLAPASTLLPGGTTPIEEAGTPEVTPVLPAPGHLRWMLILSMGAKRLLIGVIVLGVAGAIGVGVVNATAQNHANLVQMNNQLVSNLNTFTKTANACPSVSCLEQADGALSQQLESFVSALERSDTGGISQSTLNEMIGATENAQHVTAALSEAGPSLSGYRKLATALGTQQAFTRLDSAQHAFVQEVNAGRIG